MSFYQARIAELQAKSAKIVEEIKGLQLAEAASQDEAGKVIPSAQRKAPRVAKPAVAAANGEVKRGRGRPKKVIDASAVSASSDGEVKRGRGRPKKTDNDGKSMSLSGLLMTIAQESKDALTSADFVTKAREAGYKTKSDNFGNMVYQALVRLVKDGKFKKNTETKAYEFVANAA